MIFDLNLEVQFLLKQGQVEVDMGKFIPDFSDSVLVHRSCIEELNGQIKVCMVASDELEVFNDKHEYRLLEKENCILWLNARISKEELGC